MNYQDKQSIIKTFAIGGAIVIGGITLIQNVAFMQNYPGIARTGGGFAGSTIGAFGGGVAGVFLGALVGVVVCLLVPRDKTTCPQCGREDALKSDKSLVSGKLLPNTCKNCGHTWTSGAADVKQAEQVAQVPMTTEKPAHDAEGGSSRRNTSRDQPSSPTIIPQSDAAVRVYKRATDLEENAEVDNAHETDGDAGPLRVRRKDCADEPTYESTKTFNCPQCGKLYEVDAGSPNLVFKCVQCEQQMLVHIG